MEILKLFSEGGPVMWPLLVCSILTLALSFERIRFWLKINKRQRRVVSDVLNLYRLDNLVAAIDKLRQNIDLPIARIFLAALELERSTPEKFRLALEGETQAELPILKRFQRIFETIVGLAPLLGLLGTITGLIRSFAGLNIGDVGGTKTTSVTGGISEALIATACGMVVAIIALLFTNLFEELYTSQLGLIQEFATQLELLYLDRYEKGHKTYASNK
ncbi:MAG: MotA/TolQ/ExbB proton channel family protein [Nostoc sp.]|uniref:MotA/TolQ/ExbB proton channel family protein n=1 Tax=Nostoc sp. TaxID=1180 RepID=UPI002FF70642